MRFLKLAPIAMVVVLVVLASPLDFASCVPGDVAPVGNTDGVVTVSDVVKMLRFSVGLESPTAEDLARADIAPAIVEDTSTNPPTRIVEGNGTIDVTDVVLALRTAVGLNQLRYQTREKVITSQEDSNDIFLIMYSIRIGTCADLSVSVQPGLPNVSVSSVRNGDELRIMFTSTAGGANNQPMQLSRGLVLAHVTYQAPTELDETTLCTRSCVGYTAQDGSTSRNLAGMIRLVNIGDENIGPDVSGTSLCIITDTDGDGATDNLDNCLHISNPGQADGDDDGVGDACDNCPSVSNSVQVDVDADGIGNDCDNCPNDPNKVEVGTCGCGVAETDSDGDHTADCVDNCPHDPAKTTPGSCGCGRSDTDTDGDGRPDCTDNCPNDPLKSAPGVCGCGHSDVDTDADGVADCFDLCPSDPNKVGPGTCGCGVADTDSDSDGLIDCHDNCPSVWNHGQEDGDSDGVGNVCDNCPSVSNSNQADGDHDRLGDACEASYQANPAVADTDSDGVLDGDEVRVFLTNANLADTDADGVSDGFEIYRYNTDPKSFNLDNDHDGFPDAIEAQWGITNRFGADLDTDHDGFPDIVETQVSHTDPNDPSSWPSPGI